MIEFILNNKVIKTSENAGMTLLDFIREKRDLKGTKIGCREGDCGACTVLVGTLIENKSIEYQSITCCISPLGNAHGKHIVTIEGTNLENKQTAAQKTMSDNSATQCGFCTPGFVVSLTGYALSNKINNYSNSLDAIGGNICRCTGYKSIERAAKSLTNNLENKDQSKPILWLIENDFIPSYFAEIPERLAKLNIKYTNKENTDYVAGGTDLYVHQADALSEKEIHLVAHNNEMRGVSFYKDSCAMGGLTTVSDMMDNNALSAYFPDLKKYLKLISSEPIRNMATLAGNFVNASPIGDMTIFFLGLDSKITIKNKAGKLRTIELKKFYQSYKVYDLKEEEIITNITFKLPKPKTKFNFEKVSKRTHLDIASVNTAISLKMEGNYIDEAHLSIGGVAPIPKYLHETSTFLIGKELTSKLILKAAEILQNEISPISDVRGSSDYKRLLARQLFFAHFIKFFPEKFNLKKLLA
jgi:xanthine dehydrogenase small subunit